MKFRSINLKPLNKEVDISLTQFDDFSLILNASADTFPRVTEDGNFELDLVYKITTHTLSGEPYANWSKEYNFEIERGENSVEDDKKDLFNHIRNYFILSLNAYSGNRIEFQNEVYPKVNLIPIFDKTRIALDLLGFWDV